MTLKANVTPWRIFIVMALMTLALAIWFVVMVKGSTVNYEPTRAVTPAQYDGCASLPRGSQVMENKRRRCFDGITRGKRHRISRELVARD